MLTMNALLGLSNWHADCSNKTGKNDCFLSTYSGGFVITYSFT